MAISLDLGYGWAKGRNGSRIFLQPSLLGDAQPMHEENRKDGYMTFDGYFVGDLALKYSDVKYYSLKESKAETWTTAVLMKAALTYLQTGPTNLVTGLPVDYFFQQKDSFTALIDSVNGTTGELEVFGDGTYRGQIDIRKHKIVPQPLGAAMDYLLDEAGVLIRKDEARGRILVIDWGRYTLDLLILDGMEIHKSSCSPADLGIDAAYKLLRRYLREHTGKAPATYAMDIVMETGQYEGMDVKPLIDAAFGAVIQQIQLEVEGLNTHFHTHILAGGQAKRLDEHLQLENKVVGNQASNVDGYAKLGARAWGAI